VRAGFLAVGAVALMCTGCDLLNSPSDGDAFLSDLKSA
jgi:hypothetical protein